VGSHMTDVFVNWESVTDSMKLRNGSAFREVAYNSEAFGL